MGKTFLLIILVGTILLLSACEFVGDGGKKVINIVSASESNDCEGFSKMMIPKTLHGEVPSDDVVSGLGGYWNDGAEIGGVKRVEFGKGRESGENVDYYYPRDSLSRRKTLDYSKKIVGEGGVVVGDYGFTVLAVLKPLPETITVKSFRVVAATVEIKEMDYEIVSYSFDDCYMPEGIDLARYISVGEE